MRRFKIVDDGCLMMDVYNLPINYKTLRKREVFLPQKRQKKFGWKYRYSKDCIRMIGKFYR